MGIISFKFEDLEALDKVLDGVPWHMANRPVVLSKWRSNLTLLKEDLNSVALWVKLF